MEFERYYAGALHEAGHAVTAAIFGREILEISIREDQDGGGYVHREQREGSPHEVLEEILIALAGEETPYLGVIGPRTRNMMKSGSDTCWPRTCCRRRWISSSYVST